MTRNIIITGAMGSGKSTVLKLLKERELIVVEEPARNILAEQRSIDGEGIPEKNSELFTHLLLSRTISQYKQMQNTYDLVIYDRGIPDNIAYAKLFNLSSLPASQAAKLYRYDKNVFIFPEWEDIYSTDDERIMSFEAAKKFGYDIQMIYKAYGYNLIEVPRQSPEKRAQFIMERI